MLKKISKKQEKVQKKIQKQQELNDKDCRELTDEELEQIVGGAQTKVASWVTTGKVTPATLKLGTAQGKTVTVVED